MASREQIKESYYSEGPGEYRVKIEFVNPEKWNYFLGFNTHFLEYFKPLFRDIVYSTHKYLIRLTPIATGRLRAGWTGILRKYNVDYTAAFLDTSLVEAKNFGPLAGNIQQGFDESGFIDSDFDVTIVNDVPYGHYNEFGTSRMQGQWFVERARYKGEYIAEKALGDWFKEIEAKGVVAKPKPVEEVAA